MPLLSVRVTHKPWLTQINTNPYEKSIPTLNLHFVQVQQDVEQPIGCLPELRALVQPSIELHSRQIWRVPLLRESHAIALVGMGHNSVDGEPMLF